MPISHEPSRIDKTWTLELTVEIIEQSVINQRTAENAKNIKLEPQEKWSNNEGNRVKKPTVD